MDVLEIKFYARVLSDIEYRPGAWKGQRVGVFQEESGVEKKVGEYERNYPSLFNTFFHFKKDGNDYALYSPDYTVTRIMELPSCKDIGGEDPSPGGFCPTDYFIPTFIQGETSFETTSAKGTLYEGTTQRTINNPMPKDLVAHTESKEFEHQTSSDLCVSTVAYRPLSELRFHEFGFVSGCIWGDDSTWKIQFLDLSQAEKGVLKRDERFGYIVLPEDMRLKDAIDMYDYGWDENEESTNYIRINITQTFDLRNGRIVGPFD